MSLTNTDPAKIDLYPKFDWPRILNPKLSFPVTAEVFEKVCRDEELALAQIKQAIHDNPDDIAALIIEPIQAEGGDNHFRPEFLHALRQVTQENDILFILDEVQTGIGITGKMWAHQHFNLQPDIICFGKKTQICGIAVSRKIDDVKDNVFHLSSRINSTWGGNLADMVRSCRYLQIIEEDKLVENAAEVGGYVQEKIHGLGEAWPGTITNVRGKGLFTAFDLPDRESRHALLNLCKEEGVILLPCGNRSIRLRPPLDIDRAAVDDGFARMDKAMARLQKNA